MLRWTGAPTPFVSDASCSNPEKFPSSFRVPTARSRSSDVVESLISKTSYPNYDIVIVQVGERDKVHEAGADFRVLHFPDAANASAAKNYAVATDR